MSSTYDTFGKFCGKIQELGGVPITYIQSRERHPRLDVTAGIVDLQRVWADSSHFEPEMASRIGLHWY